MAELMAVLMSMRESVARPGAGLRSLGLLCSLALWQAGCSPSADGPREPSAPNVAAAPPVPSKTLAASAAAAAAPLKAQSGDLVDAGHQQDAQQFWSSFRQAALARDGAGLAVQSGSPLRIRGELDSDPVRKVSGSGLPGAITGLLDRKVFQGAGRPQATLHALIEQTEALPPSSWVSATQLRVHSLVFQRGADGRWRLTQAYVEDE